MILDDWAAFLTLPREDLLGRYVAVCRELAGLHMELATVRVAERQAKVRGFHQSVRETIAARERDADLNALDITASVFELVGEVEAATQERDLLLYLLGDDERWRST